MATQKTVNYTEEMTAEAKAMFAAGFTLEEIAKKVGRSVRSVTAKLSREGVYVAKAKTPAGKAGEAKGILADKICAKANIPADFAEGLAKANKQALVGILAALNRD